MAKHNERAFQKASAFTMLFHINLFYFSASSSFLKDLDILPELSLNQEMEVDYFFHNENSEMIFECKRILQLP